jgi:DNA-binding GntR family transcriptional regulator
MTAITERLGERRTDEAELLSGTAAISPTSWLTVDDRVTVGDSVYVELKRMIAWWELRPGSPLVAHQKLVRVLQGRSPAAARAELWRHIDYGLKLIARASMNKEHEAAYGADIRA